MRNIFRPPKKLDPAEWIIIFLSWMIYSGGLIFFSEAANYWLLMALGALPVLVTAWSLGMNFGVGSAVLSNGLHFLVHYFHPAYTSGTKTLLFHYLTSFTLLAVTGMLIGHLRDIQVKSRKELDYLTKTNQRLTQLSRALEATNRLTTDLINTQDWMDKIPDFLRNISSAAGIDHLFLLQLTGNGIVNYSGNIHHYWSETQAHVPDKILPVISPELIPWINTAKNDIPVHGSLLELSEGIRKYLFLKDVGEFVVLPIFIDTALWGFIGFESYQSQNEWNTPELTTFRNIAQTLGSIIYKKLIEDHLNIRAKELDSIQKATTNVASGDQLEAGLQIVLSQIYEHTPAYDTNIYLYQDQVLNFYLSLGKNKQQTLPFPHPGEEVLSLLVAESNQDYFISNISKFKDITVENNGYEEAVISLSLKTDSKVIGVLNIWYSSTRNFNLEERNILRLLADQATTAIINIQYLQKEREQRILADSLRKANLLLSDNLELKEVLESILNQVLAMVSARDAQIFLYDGDYLEFGAVMYAENVQPDPVHPLDSDCMFYLTAREGKRILVPDIQAEKRLQETWKTGALVSLPLIFHNKVIGIMNVTFFEPGTLDSGLLQTLDLLSNQAAIAINNARTFETERKQRKLAQALQHTGRAIQSSLDLEVVLDQILIQIANVIPYNSANLILIENGEARVVRQQGFQGKKGQQSDQPVTSFDVTRFTSLVKMAHSKNSLTIPDTELDPDWVKTETTKDVLSWIGAPILDGDHVIGFLSLNNHIRNFYTEDQAEILSAFASQATIALTHARLHKEIHELAVTDPLTKILNRRGLERWGQYEVDRANRFISPLSAIFFDLDHFKIINDKYGHDAGDDVLKQIVSCCKLVIRKIDIFSRIGGEEFFIILPETSLPIAIQVAERIRETVADSTFRSNSHEMKITLSLGVVELNEEIDTLPKLMNSADQYMYQSKQTGRNKTSYLSN